MTGERGIGRHCRRIILTKGCLRCWRYVADRTIWLASSRFVMSPTTARRRSLAASSRQLSWSLL